MSLLGDRIREQARRRKSSVLIGYSSGQDGPFLSLLHYCICACTVFVYRIHINVKSDMTLQRCWLIFIRACTILFMYS